MHDDQALFQEAADAIVDGDITRAQEVARMALARQIDPMVMLEKGFIAGLNKVGDLFERGELFLPELIQCAEVMKEVTGMLNAAITAEKKASAGKVLIATVEGDFHDIGKGIVVSLLKAHGFEVYDAGRDVPIATIIEKAEELQVDVIGTSALLTTTMGAQKDLEDELRRRGLRDKYKTVVGGAPVTERWARRIGADAYAEDANEGVKVISELIKSKG